MGIVSNGGAFFYLLYCDVQGTRASWVTALQVIGWGSVPATLLITAGLIIVGLGENREAASIGDNNRPARWPGSVCDSGAREPWPYFVRQSQ